MSAEDKKLSEEQIENVVGGQDYSFYSEENVSFYHSVGETIGMVRSGNLVHGTITDRGIYKKATHAYYACYYVDLNNVTGDGWFYDDNGIEFSHRISKPDKQGL